MALTKIDDRGLKTPIDLLDNEKIRLGTGTDFEIHHKSADNGNYIESQNSRSLYLEQDQIFILNEAGNEYMIHGVANGSVSLYHNNSKKLETTSGGVDLPDQLQVDGTVFATGGLKINADSTKLRLGAGDDLELYHNGTHSYLDNSTGSLFIRGDAIKLRNAAGNEAYIECFANGAVKLSYDDSIKFETTSDGVEISGGIKDADFLRIGTTSTSGISGSADDLIIGAIGDSTDRGITLATTGNGSIRWADAGDNAMGRIAYSNSTDVMTIHTSNATRLRVDSDGLKFGSDSAAANALSDYEEGTWTPVLYVDGASSASGKYTKIGRMVYATFQIIANSSSSGTHQYISGLPFTTQNAVPNAGGVARDYQTYDVEDGPVYHVSQNDTIIYLYKNAGQNLVGSNLSGLQIRGTAIYTAT